MSDDPSVVRTVSVSAEIVRATNPHTPPRRVCKVCGAPAAAGSRWCHDCRGTTKQEGRRRADAS